MKKARFLLLLLLSASGMTAQAQSNTIDYRPMAQDGKWWETQVGGIKENVYDCFIEGDTLINGDNWKKVYKGVGWPGGSYTYYAAIRDEGKKVYAIAKGSNRARLLYDFGLKVGDLARCGVESNDFACLLDKDEKSDNLLGYPFVAYLRVESIDTIKARGQEFRCFTLRLLDAYRELIIFADPVIWVEGIGSGAGPFSPWLPMPTTGIVIDCKERRDAMFLFPKDLQDLQEPNAVRSEHSDMNERDVIFNLLGRQLQGKPQRGVYIQDGRKVVIK